MNHNGISKIILSAFFLIGIGHMAKAQQFIISDNMFEDTSFPIEIEVRDSVTKEPIGFASVYLQHPGDTLMTNFTLTEASGKASIKKVTKGEYVLTVEFLGYLPYHKTFYARNSKDLGIAKMVPDIKSLNAAKVSAAVNPIEVRKDTVIYNAAAYKVAQNAYLVDLLKKMPGIEVDDKGNVKVNGKEVSKITIGGKTFFMGDNSAALNNLPAKVVKNVKVIDKDSDASAFSGIADEQKQKVMDVELKDEYKKGHFGNLKIGAGNTAYGNKDEFKDKRNLLYSNNGMLSMYNEKDQLTMIESTMNAQMQGDGVAVMHDDDNDEGDQGTGLPKASMIGANLNTSRWKGMESNISASLKSNRIDDYRLTDRTTLQENSENINNTVKEKTYSKRNSIKVSGDFEKTDKKKYTLSFSPSFYYSDTDDNSDKESTTAYGSVTKNNSSSLTGSSQKYYKTEGEITLGIKDIGKKSRALTFSGEYVLGGSDGNSFEQSSTYYNALDTTMERNLLYDKTYSNYSLGGSVQYVEPIMEGWALQTLLSSYYKVRKTDNDASNADGTHNSYYSSNSDNYYFTNYGRLLLQYKKDATSLQFGGLARAISNENYANSFGVDTRTGEDEWLWNFAPFIRLRANFKNNNYSVNYNGNSSRPSQANIAPALNIANPTRIMAGNIYLTPSFSHFVSFSIDGSNKEKHMSYSLYCNSSIDMKKTVTASWFDANSVQYSVPVNSRKNGITFSMSGSFSTSLNKKKNLRFSLYSYAYMSESTSYQSTGILEGLNTDNFDYSAFMSEFWGNSKGDRFYSGQSGFKESDTHSYSIYVNPSLRYTGDFLTLECAADIYNKRSTYSIDSKANTDTWNCYYFFRPAWTTAKDLEISSSIGYNTYYGFRKDFNYKIWVWNASLSKSIRGITVSLMADDILNQNKNEWGSSGDNYYQDYRRLVIGRKIMLSLTFNFGKSNAAKSQAAQNSLWDLMW